MRFFGDSKLVQKYKDIVVSPYPEINFPLYWEEGTEPSSWVANTFERDVPENIHLVPLTCDEPWRTVANLVARFKPKEVLGIFAPFLQIDDPFDRAIQALGMNTFCVTEEKIRIGVATVEQLEIGGIVLTQPALSETLEQIQNLAPSAPPYFQVVLGVHERPTTTDALYKIFYEIHLVPGMVGFFQCQHLAGSPSLFHLNLDFVWEHEGNTLLVTDIRRHRFLRARFPSSVLVQEAACSCGATMNVLLA